MPGKLKAVRLYGYNRVRNSLRRIAADNPEVTDDPLYRFAESQRKKLKQRRYPPKLPMQVYERTGLLANSWAVLQVQQARYQVINTARSKRGKLYAGWVVGEKQADIHKGRWWIAKEVVAEDLPLLRTDMEEVLHGLWY